MISTTTVEDVRASWNRTYFAYTTGANVSVARYNAPDAEAGWVLWPKETGGNDHWYKAVSVPGGVTQTDAKAAAGQEPGAYLATVMSLPESNFVRTLLNASHWSGNRGPWIGASQYAWSEEPSGGWYWHTAEPWIFQDWAPGQPDDLPAGADAVCLYGSPAKWADMPAQSLSPSYVTERGGAESPTGEGIVHWQMYQRVERETPSSEIPPLSVSIVLPVRPTELDDRSFIEFAGWAPNWIGEASLVHKVYLKDADLVQDPNLTALYGPGTTVLHTVVPEAANRNGMRLGYVVGYAIKGSTPQIWKYHGATSLFRVDGPGVVSARFQNYANLAGVEMVYEYRSAGELRSNWRFHERGMGKSRLDILESGSELRVHNDSLWWRKVYRPDAGLFDPSVKPIDGGLIPTDVVPGKGAIAENAIVGWIVAPDQSSRLFRTEDLNTSQDVLDFVLRVDGECIAWTVIDMLFGVWLDWLDKQVARRVMGVSVESRRKLITRLMKRVIDSFVHEAFGELNDLARKVQTNQVKIEDLTSVVERMGKAQYWKTLSDSLQDDLRYWARDVGGLSPEQFKDLQEQLRKCLGGASIKALKTTGQNVLAVAPYLLEALALVSFDPVTWAPRTYERYIVFTDGDVLPYVDCGVRVNGSALTEAPDFAPRFRAGETLEVQYEVVNNSVSPLVNVWVELEVLGPDTRDADPAQPQSTIRDRTDYPGIDGTLPMARFAYVGSRSEIGNNDVNGTTTIHLSPEKYVPHNRPYTVRIKTNIGGYPGQDHGGAFKPQVLADWKYFKFFVDDVAQPIKASDGMGVFVVQSDGTTTLTQYGASGAQQGAPYEHSIDAFEVRVGEAIQRVELPSGGLAVHSSVIELPAALGGGESVQIRPVDDEAGGDYSPWLDIARYRVDITLDAHKLPGAIGAAEDLSAEGWESVFMNVRLCDAATGATLREFDGCFPKGALVFGVPNGGQVYVELQPRGGLKRRSQPLTLVEGEMVFTSVLVRRGDVNEDGTINLADFLRFRQAFGSSWRDESPNWNSNADVNGDGTVDIADFLVFRRNFGLSGN